jgi:glucan biosynthesis protein C
VQLTVGNRRVFQTFFWLWRNPVSTASLLSAPPQLTLTVITPFIEFVELGNEYASFNIYGFLSGTGVMWFAVALFIFSLIYGVARLIVRRPVSARKHLKPSLVNAVILILIISVWAFLIRIVQPIGTSILNMQLCFFASYIILFVVGIIAYRNNLFAATRLDATT